ncbi:MAG TPA: hypothetical protein GX708_20475 [Gallicola sp.]|nr:hypothetical protein [Gallicola sp.]
MLKQKKDFFCIPVAIILTLLLYFNISLVTSDDGQETFDTYSEGIIISNLLFDNSYANETSFLRMMNPDMIFSDGHTGMYSDIVNDYISNTPPLKDEFGIYHSNLVFHRYIYSAIDAIFGHTKLSLKLMHFFNAFLFGLVLMYMIIWIKKITDSITGYILLVIISLFTPYLSMYATNLYWSAWSLFLPIVGSIFVLNIKEHRTKRSMFFISFIAAFITCTIKEVFYFEFVSTVMIAMMIPYIFYTVDKKWELKSTIKLCIFPIIGAILSFVVVSLIKLILLAKDFGSFKEATNMYLGPIVTRLLGDPTNNNPLISNSATESLLKVIQNMLAIPAFSVRFIGSLSHLKLIFVFIFLVVLVKLLESKSSIIFNRSIRNLAIIVCLSFFAPLSWFVLAKPHVAVHTIICSIVLYLPFTLLLIAFIVFTGRKVLEHLCVLSIGNASK